MPFLGNMPKICLENVYRYLQCSSQRGISKAHDHMESFSVYVKQAKGFDHSNSIITLAQQFLPLCTVPMHKVCTFLLKPGNPIALLLYHMRPKTHSGQFSLNLLHFLHSKIIIVVGEHVKFYGG